MDLFNQINLYEEGNKLIGAWSESLLPSELAALYNSDLVIRKGHLKSSITIYPDYNDTYKIFHKLSLNQVKVVILGQDPYHNGNANGYAFGCKQALSPSLNEIVKAIQRDCKVTKPEHPNSGMDLQYLVDQGVMLLNTLLSVEAGKPLSHSKGKQPELNWATFIKGIIRTIATSKDEIIWLLWGEEAKKYSKMIDHYNHHNHVLTFSHPASARYRKVDWNCNHFAITNSILQTLKLKPIQWL